MCQFNGKDVFLNVENHLEQINFHKRLQMNFLKIFLFLSTAKQCLVASVCLYVHLPMDALCVCNLLFRQNGR